MLTLGPKARLSIAAGYAVLQLGLIAYGLYAPDHVFGFQMFNESSRTAIHLFRQLDGGALVPVAGGAWEARDAAGRPHFLSWRERIHYGPLTRLDVSVHASYGLSAQLFRLQKALEDVAAHIPEDAQTRALVAVVDARHNGRKLPELRLIARRP